MAFDFSKYTGDTTPGDTPPTSIAPLPAGITPEDAAQMWQLQGSPVDNPDDRMVTDTDGAILGAFKDLHPDEYAAQKSQWDEQQKLADAGLLTGAQKIGGAEGG